MTWISINYKNKAKTTIYRAWDTEKSIMYKPEQFSLFYVGWLHLAPLQEKSEGDVWKPLDILMESVGRLDDKGTEIFELDLVKYTLIRDSGGVEIYSDVEWVNYAWRLSGIFLLSEVSKIEVVCNQFEHYDLWKNLRNNTRK
jgi:hypothetical protein